MQEWVTVIIVLLIVGILLDGVRRMRIAQRDKIRMSRSIYKNQSSKKDDSVKDTYTSELPNGGARVISKREGAQLARDSKPARDSRLFRESKKAPLKSRRDQSRSPEQARLNLDESVPLLMESVTEDVLLRGQRDEMDEHQASHLSPQSRQLLGQQESHNLQTHSARADVQYRGGSERIEPTFAALAETPGSSSDISTNNDAHDDTSFRDASSVRFNSSAKGDRGHRMVDDEQDDNYYEEPDTTHGKKHDGEPYDEEHPEEDYEDDEGYDNHDDDGYDDDDYEDNDGDEDHDRYEDDDEEYDEDEEPESVAANQPQAEPEEVLIINIMAFKGETFNGNDLLDIVLKCGMRYGDMDIFHRYSDPKGEGALLFSMANMVKPGIFDLDAMDQFETPGVSLFMTLPLNADSMQSFDLMVDTARAIAETLDGELKDEQRSVMTRQTIEHSRQRIRDFELKRLSRSRH